MKIDPWRCDMLPVPLPFEARGIRMKGNLVARLLDGRVDLESEKDRPRIARARSSK